MSWYHTFGGHYLQDWNSTIFDAMAKNKQIETKTKSFIKYSSKEATYAAAHTHHHKQYINKQDGWMFLGNGVASLA